MPVLVLRKKATKEEVREMLKDLDTYIKVAVDVSQGILAGGGILHADCRSALIQEGSQRENIWGADWYPEKNEIRFEAMINIAPGREKRSLEIQDLAIRDKITEIVQKLLGSE